MNEPVVPIAELFATDPLTRSTADFEAIIAHFRANRKTYMVAASSGQKAPATKTIAKAITLQAELGITNQFDLDF